MTRRERHLYIIDRFPTRFQRYCLSVLIARHGFDLFTDEAIERLTVEIVGEHRRSQKMAAHNREVARRRQAHG